MTRSLGRIDNRPWLSFVAGSVFLVTAIFIAYLPALHGGPVWDDDYMLTANPVMTDPHALWRTFFDLSANKVYYPVTLAVFWLESRFFGLQNLAGYHAVNTLLHAVNAILLWRLLRQLEVRGAFAVAAVWGLHPINVESVAWVTELKNTLSGVFYFGAMWSLLRYYQAIAPGGSHRGRWYVAGLIGFAAALGAKTTAVTLPAAALLIVWWKTGRLRTGNLWAIVPFLLIAAASGSLTQYVETHITAGWDPAWGLDRTRQVLVAGRAIWFYAGKLAWPEWLSFIYPRWSPDPSVLWQWICPAGVAAVLLGLWLTRHRIGRGPVAGILFFCGTLAPALSFFHVLFQRYSFVADHFQYLAGIGFIAVLVGSAARLELPRKIEVVLVASVLITLSILTFKSSRRFISDESVWHSVLECDAGSPLANLNYGTDLKDRRALDEAIPYIQRASSSKMLMPNVYLAMGQVEEARRNYPQALIYYSQAARLARPEPLPHMLYGTMLLVTGQFPAAAEQLRTAIDLDPKMAEAHDNLGVCLLHMGRIQDARDEFETARLLDPKLPLLEKHLAEAADAQRGRGVTH